MATSRDKLEVLLQLRDKLTAPLKKASTSIGSFAQKAKNSLLSVKTAVVGLGAALAVGGIARFTAFAAEIETISSSFESLAQSVGQAGNDIIAAMQRASEGTISRLDLMKIANNALITNVAKSPAEFGRLTEAALKLGRAMGVEATEAAEKLLVALARQSKLRLDDLGIIIDTAIANEKYAASLGKSTTALTDQERATAFITEALSLSEQALKRLGLQTATVSGAFGRFKAAVADTAQEIARSFVPILAEGFERLGEFVKNNRAVILNFLADFLDAGVALAEVLADVGRKVAAFLGVFKSTAGLPKLREELAATEEQLAKLRETFAGRLTIRTSESQEQNRLELLRANLQKTIADLERFERIQTSLGRVSLSDGLRKTSQGLRDQAAAAEAAASAVVELKKETVNLGAFVGPPNFRLIEGFVGPEDFRIVDDFKRGFQDLGRVIGGTAVDIQRFGADSKAEFDTTGRAAQQAGSILRKLADDGKLTANEIRSFFVRMGRAAVQAAQGLAQFGAQAERLRGIRILDLRESAQLHGVSQELAGIGAGLNQLANEWGDTFANMQQAVLQVGDAIVNNLSNGIVDLITGAKNFKEAVRDMARSILRDLAQILTRLLIIRTLGFALSPLATPGGGFQKGGIVPREGLFHLHPGERVIPAATTRAQDAAERGAGGGRGVVLNVTYNIAATDAQSFDNQWRRSARQHGRELGQLVATAYQDNPRTRARFS